MNDNKLHNNNTGNAGEHFAMFQLARRGYAVGPAPRGARDIDLLAYRNGRAVAVQVKPAFDGKASNGWRVDAGRVQDNVVYVFLDLNVLGFPDAYICTANETRSKVRSTRTDGTPLKPGGSYITLHWLKSCDYFERWDKIEKALKILT